MLVFKTFLKIGKKHISIILTYLVVFASLTLMLSNAAAKEDVSDFEIKSVKIAIMDEDETSASKSLIQYLSKHHEIVSVPFDEETIQDKLFYRTIGYALIIPKGFEDSLTAQNLDHILKNVKVPGSYEGTFVDYQIDQYINYVNLYLTADYSLEDALSSGLAIANNSAPVYMEDYSEVDSATDNNTATRLYYFYLFLAYVLLAMLIVGLTPIIITFKNMDLRNRMNCSILTSSRFNFQITLGCIIYSLGMFSFFLILGLFSYGSAFFSATSLLSLLNAFAYVLVCVSIALLLSYFKLSANGINMCSNVLSLGSAFLCGVFVSQWLLGEKIVMFSRILPTYWYVKACNILYGYDTIVYNQKVFLQHVGVQFLFAFTFFSIAVLISKYQKLYKS